MKYIIILLSFLIFGCSHPSPKLRIGCKNFTEQLILGEIVSGIIQQNTPEIPIEKKWGFGSTPLIHQALVSGEIDLYLEYTGTAEQLILKSEKKLSLEEISQSYQKQFHARWLPSLGFSNGYVLVVRADSPLPPKLSQSPSMASTLKAGMNAEYANRPDGFPLLQKIYGLHFASITNLDVGLLYPALDSRKIDLISGFATDAKLSSSHYRILEDDLGISPRYEPAPVVHLEALQKFPSLEKTLLMLSGIITEKTMQKLNAQVEIDHQTPAEVAQNFLKTNLTQRHDDAK
ncbi:MAG: glycine betaine ABC transporter substrate-binding protein [Verrucomicrobiota bacterium]